MPNSVRNSENRSRKDPEATRQAVLFAAFEEMHLQGFQAASLTNILNATGLTKGALYHHFSSKQALGYAVLDEVIAPMVEARWVHPLQVPGVDPIACMTESIMLSGAEMSDGDLALGCPLNNLAQEMSPVDEGFRLRINALFERWRVAMAGAMEAGKAAGIVRDTVDATATAAFIVAALEGCVGMAKNARSRDVLMQCGQGVLTYLESLRA